MDILCDIDGVLADMHVMWLQMYNDEYGDTLTQGDITAWAIHNFVKDECGLKIYDYLKLPEMYIGCPTIPGALAGVKALRDRGHKVYFTTAGIFPAKFKWLETNGFLLCKDWEFSTEIITCHDKHLISGDVLIDDGPLNFEGRGLFDAIVFDAPWNRFMDSEHLVARTWPEVVHMVHAIQIHKELE